MSVSSSQQRQEAYTVGSPTSSYQIQQLGRILAQCFNVSLDYWHTYVRQLGSDNLRVIFTGKQVLGGLSLYPMGQWFGGQRIPMHGIAGVGIAPEYRGARAALTLLMDTVKTLHQQRVPLATLYASTSQLYRQVGFEQAGTYCQYQIPAQSLVTGDHSLPMSAMEPSDLKVLTQMYQQYAQHTNGNLDRHPALWEQMLETETPIYIYRIGSDQQPQGYVIFTHQAASGGYDLRILDGVWLTPSAGQRLWTFFADHRSLVGTIRWYGAPVEVGQLFLPEQTYQVVTTERWLLRIIDVPKALSLRGYPPMLETELHFQIEDPQLPRNSGNFVLQVAQGQGQVRSGGQGDLKLHIRGLSPLYTSMLTAQELQTLGFLEASPEVLALATLLFSGPQPWLRDHF
jgi:predicted acetyltransferase